MPLGPIDHAIGSFAPIDHEANNLCFVSSIGSQLFEPFVQSYQARRL